ncbi:MAG: PilT/PilU family type 4a pilus ATPase [bacterium]
MIEITDLLRLLVQKNASDLHIRSGCVPVIRVDGKLFSVKMDKVSPSDAESIAMSVMNDKQKEDFANRLECDLSMGVPNIGRFRLNIYRQRGSINMALRIVPTVIPGFDELRLPSAIKTLSENARGLILVTGPTGCGKSTTLSSMIDYINSTRSCHIITIEDPIEFLHKDKKSIVSQRELGIDTLDYPEALKHVVRQDPDVILVGEMRDLATMAAAITAAQTGHLVLSTVHTIDTVQTISRIVDLFPPHQQNQIRYMLADTLKGVVSQRLMPHESGKGRVAAIEVLVCTAIVRKMIEENTLGEISNIIKQGAYYGMQTFNQALVKLYNEKLVTLEDALNTASNPEELMLTVRGIESGTDAGNMFDHT